MMFCQREPMREVPGGYEHVHGYGHDPSSAIFEMSFRILLINEMGVPATPGQKHKDCPVSKRFASHQGSPPQHVIPFFSRPMGSRQSQFLQQREKYRNPDSGAPRGEEEMLLSFPTASEDRYRSFRGLAQHFEIRPCFTAKNRYDVDTGFRALSRMLPLPVAQPRNICK